jgi:hypothetical protein
MLNTTKTEGASGPVYSASVALQGGIGQQVLPALPGTTQNKYRIVGAQVSVGRDTTVYIYHGTDVTKKVVVGAIFKAAAPPASFEFGDWAVNQAASNEPVQCDNANGNVVITLQYQRL